MRQWRVGTISMGASLILLGVLLFLSQMKKIDITTIFLSWWPFILIVLGFEIIVYLFMAKRENTLIKYDFLSIIFIGILGTVALSFMLLSVSGLMEEVKSAVRAEEKTYDLPSYTERVPNHINRIVIDIGDQPIELEGTKEEALQVFGTYRTNQGEKLVEQLQDKNDYLSIHEADETLYISIKKLPEKHGFIHEYVHTNISILVPVDMKLELRSNEGYQTVNIHPRELEENWFVGVDGHVNVQLLKSSNIEVMTDINSSAKENETEQEAIKVGNGKYKLHLLTTDHEHLNVTMVES